MVCIHCTAEREMFLRGGEEMDKFNSDYEEYLEKNGIGVVKNNYIIWYQCYGTYIGTKTVYNPDMTDYYEIPCEKKVAI